MDGISKANEEIRKADERNIEEERRVFAEMAAIMNTPGFLEFEKMIMQDREKWLEFATDDRFDSIMNPIPIKAIGAFNYADSLLKRIAEYREKLKV